MNLATTVKAAVCDVSSAATATSDRSVGRTRSCHGRGGRRMRWWLRALIFSVIWVGAVGVVGYITKDLFLAVKITQAQDLPLSAKFSHFATSRIPLITFI